MKSKIFIPWLSLLLIVVAALFPVRSVTLMAIHCQVVVLMLFSAIFIGLPEVGQKFGSIKETQNKEEV